MVKTKSRLLVIDASVARAAGDRDATHPTSSKCRAFLEAVHNICHGIVMTNDVFGEWSRHESRQSRKWRRTMIAKKSKRALLGNVLDLSLRSQIESYIQDERTRAIVSKDVCLIEAALASDLRIVSLDEAVRTRFAELSNTVKALRNIIWINPTNETEAPIPWLEQGAPAEDHRFLGYAPDVAPSS